MTNPTAGLLEQVIRTEVQKVLMPIAQAFAQMVTAKVVASAVPVAKPVKAVEPPVARAPRPPRAAKKSSKAKGAATACAIIGCEKPARSRGFCAVHYQKARMLKQRGELPAAWDADSHEPQTLHDMKLPRGRPVRPGSAPAKMNGAPQAATAAAPAAPLPGQGELSDLLIQLGTA